MEILKKNINKAFLNHKNISYNKVIIDSVNEVINMLNEGKIRVAEKIKNLWISYEWIKKAILLYFLINKNKFIKGKESNYYDKIPLKFKNYQKNEFLRDNIRIVPPATARKGSFIASNVILMPSYINIGAYIDTGTMIDTWVTVGSCAQIGKNVHLSGGVGIGGVLEPLQSKPTIIEDNCFIGARSEIVEGVIIESGSVISMGVYIGQSTKIYDRQKDIIYYGKVPSGSVVVPGSLMSKNNKYSLYCAVIVKKVDQQTLKKTNINELLRNIN
ncbi:2,3,4,5-tetrahydropyridine-2,6-dicarboxylate N-succinyltransferase [Candidatus Annandia adelgestsuga]|uniref:2,3,4,5-tetrahydropyridine-2,6-dicarboxylate N-succinyltransferase n=1 Tax=Candidatus Annandia adelgestsuga TaxID=1302411 RepID=A0A3S5HNV8_9ENTR|nr:2,3,4,5-tetrahydropyridine-2,6-dicarboxylate N-succinyltransferase [Candidatus Annandia adelgestsuga]AZP36168.1 2,3,4,5-tetrahydropyridine-2,6-dicarboxylate N-succinyltransferase [Candidatus Annandia adelgestsuga]